MKNRLNKIAKLLSAISSPFITLTLFGILCIEAVAHTGFELATRLVLFFLLIIGIPLAYILAGIRSGKIADLHVMVREQRPGPFVAATLGAVILLLAYVALRVPVQLVAMSAALVVCVTIFGLITLFWKISIHTAAYAGGVLMLALVTKNPIVLLLEMVLPAIIWARLRRERHNPYQAGAAAILVCACIYITFRLVTHV